MGKLVSIGEAAKHFGVAPSEPKTGIGDMI